MSKKIKITQVSKFYPPYFGGVEVVAKQISDVLNPEVFNVEVLTTSDNKKTSQDKFCGIPVKRCGVLRNIFANPVSINFIWSLFKVKTDVLHYHHPYIFAVIAHFIAKPKFKKLTITYHSDIVGYDKVMKLFNALYLRFLDSVDQIHVLSPNIIENSKVLQRYKDKCKVIPYALDLQIVETVNENKVQDIKDLYEGKIILLFVGRLIHYKGISYLIDAMKNVSDDVVLLIGGSGHLRESLEAKVKENNLSDKVKFEGRIPEEDLLSYYKACDIFMFPSILPSEAFGISQIEAMMFAKPVINTWLHTGVNFASIHEETGITVNPEDSVQLTEAINKLVEDKALASQYGINARKRVEDFFNLEIIKGKYVEFFQNNKKA